MYLLEIDKKHKQLLLAIRHWDTIRIAFTETAIWLKDFSAEQLHSPELLKIPYITVFEVKDNMLFVKGSLLPSKKMPSALLWTPIQKALPVVLPGLNHNFFGIHEKIDIQIIRSQVEREAFALLATVDDVNKYVENAPQTRLERLQWVVLENKILILGVPLLPIKGDSFWKINDAILPTGYDFELAILSEVIAGKLNPDSDCLMLWQQDSTCVKIPKDNIMPLSISSFRQTFN